MVYGSSFLLNCNAYQKPSLMISLVQLRDTGVFVLTFVNEAGHFFISGWIWAALLIILSIGIFLYLRPRIKDLKVAGSEIPQKPGLDLIQTSLYAGGHPEIRESIQPCYLFTSNGMIHFGSENVAESEDAKPAGSIPLDTLLDIRVEDVFTLKRKMTPERWLQSKDLLQPLNDRNEEDLAFVVIEWAKEGQRYVTNLCVVGTLAMEQALAKRNALYKRCRSELNRQANLN